MDELPKLNEGAPFEPEVPGRELGAAGEAVPDFRPGKPRILQAGKGGTMLQMSDATI